MANFLSFWRDSKRLKKLDFLCYLVEQEWNGKAYSGTKYSMPREAFSQENRASCAFVCIVNDFEKV